VPAKHVVPVPDNVPDEQAAMFFVNPVTAIAMTRDVLAVPPGEWLLQSAAGSALGHMIIRLGKMSGFKTINVVRRKEQAEELRRFGGDVCLSESDGPIEKQVMDATGGQGVCFAVDPVGGATGTALARCLAKGGRLLLYGLLSGQPIEADPRLMITNGATIEGFWLSHWLPSQPVLKLLSVFKQVNRLLSDGSFKTEIAATYPLEQTAQAARQAQAAARGGKVLLKISERSTAR
jgi:NADPH:quinone reductase-like Zn-dependent oxidoreductase